MPTDTTTAATSSLAMRKPTAMPPAPPRARAPGRRAARSRLSRAALMRAPSFPPAGGPLLSDIRPLLVRTGPEPTARTPRQHDPAQRPRVRRKAREPYGRADLASSLDTASAKRTQATEKASEFGLPRARAGA